MKRKSFQVPIVMMLLITLIGCNSTDDREMVEEETVPSDEMIEDINMEMDENEQIEVVEDEINLVNFDPHIQMTATAWIEEDVIVVTGESNILPGATVRLYAETLQRTNTQVPLGERVTVDENGKFQAELKPSRYEQLRLILSLDSNQPNEIQEFFGEFNENIEGPLVYNQETAQGELTQEARIEAVVDLQSDQTEIPFDGPVKREKPEDYGHVEIRIEAEVTNDHKYLYVQGQSNLIEGTRLAAEYWASDRHHMSQNHIIRPYASVNPDGSFDFIVRYNSLRKDGFLEIYSTGSGRLQTLLFETYGEQFEKITGDHVVTRPDGSKRVELRVYPEVPDLEVPEDVALTSDEEETMMRVPDDMLFDFDESRLKTEAKEILDELISTLETLDAGTIVEIRGHTDSQGSPDYNLVLSEERASSVMEYILKQGDTSHLEYRKKGFGETKPIASNEEEKGREQNRRVELVINPN